MSTLDATVSVLEAMPEDARIKVMEFTPKAISQLNGYIDYLQYTGQNRENF